MPQCNIYRNCYCRKPRYLKSTCTRHRHLLQKWSLPTRDGGRQENPCPRADPRGAEQEARRIQRRQQGEAGAGGGSSGKAGGGQWKPIDNQKDREKILFLYTKRMESN